MCRFDIRITEEDYYFLEINSVISIRTEGSSYQSMIEQGVEMEKVAIDTYLKNIKLSTIVETGILTENEIQISQKIKQLKEEAGSHSPSLFTLVEEIEDLKINVDACFLSNPYATDLFIEYLKKELISTNEIRDVLEFYPSQNAVIAKILANHLNVSSDKVFIGNGAIEIIQAIIHNFSEKKIMVNIPTFSSYYEFATDGVEVVYNTLKKENNFQLVIEDYLEKIKEEKPDTVVLINPNNPDGNYTKIKDVITLLDQMQDVKTVILDESFIHFAFENNDYDLISTASLVDKYDNLIVLKSMSKDFGIAGIRAGYALMNDQRVKKLLTNGYLWNSNGLAEYFFRLYVREDFLGRYEVERKRYIVETQKFF